MSEEIPELSKGPVSVSPHAKVVENFIRLCQDNGHVLEFYSAVADATNDLIMAAISDERERCAKIAERAFDHMSPLAKYESYNADGKRVIRLNPEASARAIAEKIRSGE